MVLYNPSSYEIYQEILPEDVRNRVSDSISAMQREVLANYSRERGLAFCDLTEGFRKHVRKGMRNLFGRTDLVHWSREGTAVAAKLILDCFESPDIRGGVPDLPNSTNSENKMGQIPG